MKLTAIAVTAMFISAPAFAQGYGGADNSSNSAAAVPATPASPSANSSSSDTRVASNQAKHRQHKKAATSSQGQTSAGPPEASPGTADTASPQPAPAPQQ